MKRLLILTLIVMLIVTGVYFLLRSRPVATSVPLPPLMSLAPADAQSLAYVDLAAMRQSGFWQKTAAHFPPEKRDADYAKFVEETGFDYTRDLDRVVLVFRGNSALPPRQFAIAEGNVAGQKIRAFAAKKGERQNVNGMEIFFFEDKDPMVFVPLSDTRAFLADATIGQLPEVAAFVKSLATPSDLSQALKERLAPVASASAFVVARVEKSTGKENSSSPLLGPLQELQGNVEWITAAARPEADRLRVQLEAESTNRMKAMQIGLMLDGVKLLLKSAVEDPKNTRDLSPEEQEEVRQVLKRSEIRREGSRVQIRLEIPHTLARAIIERGKERQ